MASDPRFTSRKVTRVRPSSVICWSERARSCRSAISSTRDTRVAWGATARGSLLSLRSISGMTLFSIAGMCTFIIQSVQSSDSGFQGSFRLSSSEARAYAARVFEQSKGPLCFAAKGSKSRWISAIFADRLDRSSSAFAAGASAGTAPRRNDARPRAAPAIASGPTRSKRARSTKLGSIRACSASVSGLPVPRWKNLRL
jgi:hypothetical protein